MAKLHMAETVELLANLASRWMAEYQEIVSSRKGKTEYAKGYTGALWACAKQLLELAEGLGGEEDELS